VILQPEFGDDDEMMEVIKEALDKLLSRGYVEIVGIDKNGEWLYQATEKGIDFYKNKRQFE